MKKYLLILVIVLFVPWSARAGLTDCGTGSYVGYSCMNIDTINVSDYECAQNHCAGAVNIQCCKAKATSNVNTGLIPKDHGGCPDGATNCGNYQLNDFLVLGTNAANIILGLVGSVSLLMFIFGGFKMLTSQGNSGKIDEGKKAIIAAVIGLVIVFSSWILVRAVMVGLGVIDSNTGQFINKDKIGDQKFNESPAVK